MKQYAIDIFIFEKLAIELKNRQFIILNILSIFIILLFVRHIQVYGNYILNFNIPSKGNNNFPKIIMEQYLKF